MKIIALVNSLNRMEQKGVRVFLKHDIEKLFPDESPKALEKSLQRCVKDQVLIRACKGVYVNNAAVLRKPGRVIEEIASALRAGDANYVSLESALSEYGAISQIPVSRITVMTTGAGGLVKTPYGEIEFTHTKRKVADVIAGSIYIKDRPLRFAKKNVALRDLYRVGRNTNMLINDEDDDE